MKRSSAISNKTSTTPGLPLTRRKRAPILQPIADASKTSPNRKMASATTFANAGFYILSGCVQPILMTICKNSGLGHPIAQVYMFFYSFGPAIVIVPLLKDRNAWPSRKTILKAIGIALFDVVATCINYVGASYAGPTIFSIVYSSVTVWTAIYSHFILKRILNRSQWLAIITVFGGLALTATDSLQLGQSVMTGLLMVTVGSALHALTYVTSEIVMDMGHDSLTVQQNCAVQSSTGCTVFLLWELLYTLPRYDTVLGTPMKEAGTGVWMAVFILMSFGFANLIHSLTFFHTLLHFPGGATSAGVMKGLQAVLVFVVTHIVFCGKTGGEEMCFSRIKSLSLLTVCGGVFWYGVATQNAREAAASSSSSGTANNIANTKPRLKHKDSNGDYEPIRNVSGSIEVVESP